MFIPPINLGGWKPSPATMSEWIYQIWKYLQENPIATQEQIKQYIEEQIGDDIAEKLPDILPEELDAYFEEHPIDFPVDSVNGKLGAVLLELADIVQSDSMLPVVSLANDEADQETLIGAFNDGARICVIDEESVSVMLPTYGLDGGVTAITLLPMSTGGGSGGGGDFSPITLSIGSSGNKTLNAGGTVAFTLAEIGAAAAADVTSLGGRMTTAENDISSLDERLDDAEADITAMSGAVLPIYHVGDTITFTTAMLYAGNFRGNTQFGFTWILPIKIGDDVSGFYFTNASANCGIYKAGSTAKVVSGAITSNGTISTRSGSTISNKALGILNAVIDFPSQSGNANLMGYIALPSAEPTIITFT